MSKKFKPKPGATVVTLLALCGLIGLGVWQLQRLSWKEALVAKIDAKLAEKTVPLPETIKEPKDWQYRRVSVAGNFVGDSQFLVKPRTHDGQAGYHLVMPFHRASGGVVFVNRGWVSDDALKNVKTDKSLTKIEGIAVLPEKSTFTPDNAPDKNDWYWIDVPAMASAAKLQSAAPVVIQITETPAGVYPIGVPVAQNVRNDHRQYAFFWFAMAGILAAIYFIYHRQGKEDGSVQAA